MELLISNLIVVSEPRFFDNSMNNDLLLVISTLCKEYRWSLSALSPTHASLGFLSNLSSGCCQRCYRFVSWYEGHLTCFAPPLVGSFFFCSSSIFMGFLSLLCLQLSVPYEWLKESLGSALMSPLSSSSDLHSVVVVLQEACYSQIPSWYSLSSRTL